MFVQFPLARPLDDEVGLHRGHHPELLHAVQKLPCDDLQVFDAMTQWIAGSSPGLDGLEGLVDGPVPDGMEEELVPLLLRLFHELLQPLIGEQEHALVRIVVGIVHVRLPEGGGPRAQGTVQECLDPHHVEHAVPGIVVGLDPCRLDGREVPGLDGTEHPDAHLPLQLEAHIGGQRLDVGHVHHGGDALLMGPLRGDGEGILGLLVCDAHQLG